jgi:hypothetical protein
MTHLCLSMLGKLLSQAWGYASAITQRKGLFCGVLLRPRLEACIITNRRPLMSGKYGLVEPGRLGVDATVPY